MLSYIVLVLALAAAVGGWIWRRKELAAADASGRAPKKLPSLVSLVGVWVFINVLAGVLWPETERRVITIGSSSGIAQIGGYTLTSTMLVCWIILLVVLLICLLIRFVAVPRMQDVPHGLQTVLEGTVNFFAKKARKLYTLAIAAGLWASIGFLAKIIMPNAEKRPIGVEIFAGRMENITVLGSPLSATVLISWIIMAVILVLCLLIRFCVVPKMKDVPTSAAQHVLETAVDFAAGYTHSTAGPLGEILPSYIFSLALFMIGCASVELFGLRAPTSDITMTFSMALITFFLINYYGIKEHGVIGRLKSFGAASPIAAPFKFISDLALPVSMACRLFGNMLAGMIVMDLIYTVLASFSFGIPSVLGLYFNLFHPLIQVFIFVTLTLTFINEAAE